MIKHIIFDCDGVLLDTEIVAAEVMSAWLQSVGVDIDTSGFIRHHTGKTFSGIINEYKAVGTLPKTLDRLSAVKEIEKKVKADIRLVDGIDTALSQIDMPKSVVSNSSINYVKSALEKFSLEHHFEDRIFSSEMVAKPKPSPLVYNLAISTLGLQKEEVLVIEDSGTGIQAATDARLQVIGFLGGSHILPGHGERLLELGAIGLVEGFGGLKYRLFNL